MNDQEYSQNTIRRALEEMLELFEDNCPDQILLTTYNLSTKFFEQNILPLCCGFSATDIRNLDISNESLNQALDKIKIVVAFDYSTQPDPKDQLKYGLLPVRMNNGRFHPKIVIMHGRDKSGVEKSVISISSANITFAGWCLNREIIGWCELNQKNSREVIMLLHLLIIQAETLYNGKDDEDCEVRKFLSDLSTKIESNIKIKVKPQEYVPEIIINLPNDNDTDISFVKRLSQSEEWDCVTILSPYWQGINQTLKAFNAKNTYFVPTINNLGLYVFPVSELRSEDCSEALQSKICYFKNWQSDRFTHAKAYFLNRNNMNRVCIGSANCTGPGLLNNREVNNVEAMMVWNNGCDIVKIPDLFEIKDNMMADYECEKKDSSPPPILPFEVAVLIDWKKMLILCKFRVFPDKKVDDVLLKVGSFRKKLKNDTWESPVETPFSGGRKIRTFTITYNENGNSFTFKGIILNLNTDDITMGYAQKIPIDLIIEELREFREKKRKGKRNRNLENDANNTRLDMEIEEIENTQFDFFGMYQGLYNLEDYFKKNPFENGFNSFGLTSLSRILNAILNEADDTPRAHIRRFMLLFELRNIALQRPKCDEQAVFLNKLQSELDSSKGNVVALLERSLEAKLQKKSERKKAAMAFESWFEKEAMRDD